MLGWQKDIDIIFVDGDFTLKYSFREKGDQWYVEKAQRIGGATFGTMDAIDQDEVPEVVVTAFKMLSASDIEVPKEEI